MKNDSMIQLALSRDHFHSSGAIQSLPEKKDHAVLWHGPLILIPPKS
jgi:hypothetical protein